MGNATSCSSCGCGEKDNPKTQTVRVNMADPHTAPPPVSGAAAAGKAGSRSTDGTPGTDRKDHSHSAYYDGQADSCGRAGGTGSYQQHNGLDSRSSPYGRDQHGDEHTEEGLGSPGPGETLGDTEHRTEKLTDGSVFEGQFRGRDRHGWGKFTWVTGGSYEGQFDGNDMHGQGTYQWSDGSTYSGQWERNNMGPRGVMQWTDGRKYDGEFRNGKKHGEGQLVWPDGRSYTGQWEAGKQHGCGVTVTGKGFSRKSQWEHGKLVRWIEDASS